MDIIMSSVLKERTNYQTNLHIQSVSMTNKAKREEILSLQWTSAVAGPHIEIRPKFTLVFMHIGPCRGYQ